MRSDSYIMAVDGQHWVLHVFDVQGEEDILAVQLKIGSRDEYLSFQDSFQEAFLEKSPGHRGAACCPACRPEDRSAWLLLFSDWVKDAYLSMPSPPTPVETKDVPEVVRLSMQCVYRQEEDIEASDVN